MNVQLAHEIELVRLHRLDAQVQVAGDLLDGLALGEHLQHLALARGQGGEARQPESLGNARTRCEGIRNKGSINRH